MNTNRPVPAAESRPGFSLLEMLVVLTIFLTILLAVYTVYDVSQANYVTNTRRWDTQSQARIALERLGRELRMAGYNSPIRVGDPLVIATNDTISIHADLGDGNGLRYITYSLRDCAGQVGTILYRNTSTTTFCGGDPFIEGVTNLTFTFYGNSNIAIPSTGPATYALDGQGPVTGTTVPGAPAAGGERDSVRQIKIALTVQQHAGTTTVPFTMTTDVALRNLLP